MTPVPPAVLDLAENLNINLPARPGVERILRPGWAAVVGLEDDPHQNMVQRLRLAPEEVAPAVAEVRAIFAARGRHRITWEIGDSASPPDLAERLLALGMVPDEPEPLAVGMVLTRHLDPGATAVTVRRATTLEDFTCSASIFHRCFGGPAPEPAATARGFEQEHDSPSDGRYLAFLDGEPVATAGAVFVDAGVVLFGAATLPEARGKGAYRALVAARWEEGRRRGTPTLIIQAGSMSRPILAALGFEEVVHVRIFLDAFG